MRKDLFLGVWVLCCMRVPPNHGAPVASTAHASGAAATAMATPRGRSASPTVYGATGPDAFDCSGLMQAAWAAGRGINPAHLGGTMGRADLTSAARSPVT